MKVNQVKKSIIIFSIMAVLSGWIGKAIELMMNNQGENGSIGMLIWLIGPFISMLGIKLSVSDIGKHLGLKLNFKKNIKLYIFSIAIFPIIVSIIYVIGKLSGAVNLAQVIASVIVGGSFEEGSNTMVIFISFMFAFILYFVKNIFEEISWRGFLTERLLLLNLNDWLVYFITAFIWSTWHIPYYMFFLNMDNPIKLILMNYVVLLVWTIMYTEMYRISRSIWPCVIIHAFANSCMMFSDFMAIREKFEWVFSCECGLIQLIICLVAGLELRKIRIKNQLSINENKEEIYSDTIDKTI